MDSQHVFCPNLACHARGQIGKGNIRIHSQVEQRYRCLECRKTFVARSGTVFYHLHTDDATITRVITLVAHGCPIPAIEAGFGIDRRTVQRWVDRAGVQCQQLHDRVVLQPRDLGQVQADELRVTTQAGVVWLAMALMVSTRLWLGAVASASRDTTLITRLLSLIHTGAQMAPLLLVMDGLASYVRAALRVFRTRQHHGGRGAPRKVLWPELCLGQVIKQVERKRVVAVRRRVAHGSADRLTRLLETTQRTELLHTAYIERLNATFRACLATLVRRTRGLARKQTRLVAGSYLIGTVYNFCTYHTSLTLPDGQRRTPAMAAGITSTCWCVADLLRYHVAPPRWQPVRHRGRRSKHELALIARWAS